MKILLVAPMPPRPQAPGAIPLVLHAQLSGLSRRNTVTVVTVAGPDPEEWEAVDRLLAAGFEVHAVHRTEPQGRARWERRRRLGSAWLAGRWPWRTAWFWEPGIQNLLDGLLAQAGRFDLVTCEDNAMGIYRFPAGLPAVLTEYEVRRPRPVDWDGALRRNPVRWALSEIDWARWRSYQPAVWRKFHRILTVSERDAESARLLAPDLEPRLRVAPFGIDLPEPLDPAAEQPGNLLFVGNFTHPPNVEAALWLGRDLMPHLRKRASGACLHLVGIYPPPAVQALAAPDVLVTGPVPEIEPYFERAAVVLAPLRIGGGMRMKVLQSLAMGKAVVGTPRAADGLLAANPPPLCIAEDVEAFADQVAHLLVNTADRRALGERARGYAAEHYSAEAFAARLEVIYREVLEENVEATGER